MMSETIVTNQICTECGSEARPHALFCYHCGGALEGVDLQQDENVSDAWFRGDIINETQKEKNIESSEAIESEQEIVEETETAEEEIPSISKPVEDFEEIIEKEKLETVEEVQEEQVQIKTKPFKDDFVENKPADSKLKSASAIRKTRKPSRLKMVEIEWEERENSTNIWFVIFALVVILFVGGLVLLSFYLK